MELAKLYDKNNSALGLGDLLKECRDNIILFSEYRIIDEIQDPPLKVKYCYELKSSEECHFVEEVAKQKSCLELFKSDSVILPSVELTISEYFEFFAKKYSALKPKIKNLTNQRNKIYAHNDKKLNFDIGTVMQSNPINYGDIDSLIEFALSLTRLIIRNLTGVEKPTEYVNINDWQGTLRCVRLGNKDS